MTTGVHDNHGMSSSQLLYLMSPVFRIGQPAMQEKDRWGWTLAELRVKEASTIERGELLTVGSWQLRGGRQCKPCPFIWAPRLFLWSGWWICGLRFRIHMDDPGGARSGQAPDSLPP